MGKIHALSQEVINKIAAGEVVERPSSVVKELMDNAYDAKASMITVEIEEGGMQKIQITDNGIGMSEEDALVAFERHTTSKINSDMDILSIKTYGFRGEALASIAAVSKVTLKTRQGDSDVGVELKYEGGNLVKHEKVGAPVGTTIIVEELFFNVPARKEFIKATAQEYKNILEVVSHYAIANPSIGLTLINNGKVIYNLPKDHLLEDRVREVFGPDTFGNLLPIFYEHPHLEVYGYVGKPELASERKKNQYIYVNKRAIENKNIAFAVKDSYSSLIPKNTYPIFVIFIDVPGNIVDVNVHPRKEEVKFSDDKLIFEGVRSACKKALERFNLTPGNNSSQQAASPFGSPFGGAGAGGFGGGYGGTGAIGGFGNPAPGGFGSKPPFGQPAGSPFAKPPTTGAGTAPKPAFGATKPYNDPFKKPLDTKLPPTFKASDKPFGTDPMFDDPFGDDPFAPKQPGIGLDQNPNGYNGQIFVLQNLYIFTETKDGVKIYDQHALHERVLFEKFKAAYKEHKDQKNTQKLAVPIVINLSVSDSELFNQNKEYFVNLGFEIEDFGPNSFKLTEIPAILVNRDLKKIVPDLLNDLENEALDKPNENFEDKMLSYLACRSAYKAGDFITDEEIYQLLSDIQNLDNKYTCPHGRPFQVEITSKELEKMFLRK